MSKYRSYAITISTAEPVEGIFQSDLEKWLKLQDYSFAVIEGGEGTDKKRHLHAQVFYKEAREKGSITKALKRIVKKHCPESKLHIAVRVSIAYNDDYQKYMEKEIIQELTCNVPEDTLEYYPSQEEQEKVKNKANAVDQYYHRLKEMFEEYCPEYKDIDDKIERKVKITKFMEKAQYVDKTLRVIRDPRIAKQTYMALYKYVYELCADAIILTDVEIEIYKDRMEEKYKNT